MTQSLVVATSYATLGIGAVCIALEDTQAPAILCNYTKAMEVLTLKSFVSSRWPHHYSNLRSHVSNDAACEPPGRAAKPEIHHLHAR